MGILRKLGLRDRRKNVAKAPEAYTGVSVGCGPGGNVILPPVTLVTPYRELSSASVDSVGSSVDMLEIQAQRAILSRVSEEESSSRMPDSPLSVGPSPPRTPPDLSPASISTPRRYSNDLANRTPVIRGQRIAEKTAIFEHSPLRRDMSQGKIAVETSSGKVRSISLDTLHDERRGSPQKQRKSLDESDSASSGSFERSAAPGVQRGDVDRKKKWLEQAFTPTGGGNMQSSDEEDENRTPRSNATPEFSFDVSPPPPAPCSQPYLEPAQFQPTTPSLSASKGASPSSIFRLHSPDNARSAERQVQSPLVRCDPMDEARAYRIWHAKGLLAFQPEKPQLKSGTPKRATANLVAQDPKGSYRHSDSIKATAGTGNAELRRSSADGQVRTSNGKLILLETISKDDDDNDGFLARRDSSEPAVVVVNPFDAFTDHSMSQKSVDPAVVALDGDAYILSLSESKNASASRSTLAPILTCFGGKPSTLQKSAAKVPVKRAPSARRILYSPASPRSAAAKSRRTSIDRTGKALQLSDLALTVFGGDTSTCAQSAGSDESPSPMLQTKTDIAQDSSSDDSSDLVHDLVDVSTIDSSVESLPSEEKNVVEPSAETELPEEMSSRALQPRTESPMTSSRRSIEISKQRTKEAVSRDALLLSSFGGKSSPSRSAVEPPTPATHIDVPQASDRVEAYQKYVEAFKVYKKDRTSVENSERAKAALEVTKAAALKDPLPQRTPPKPSAPILVSLFTGATMESPTNSAGLSKRVRVYQNHVQALKRRGAKLRGSRLQKE